jgi:hypothetical protein
MKVFDLGAWPGGWTQVAVVAVGERGIVVALDLVALEPLPEANVHLICGDAREQSNIDAALEIAGSRFDVVISDMSPKLTGIKEADQAGTVGCAELAQYVAGQVLKEGGDLVLKVFKGNDTELFVRPHQLELHHEPTEGSIPAVVHRITHLGKDLVAELRLESGEQLNAQLSRDQQVAAALERGARLHVQPRSTHQF